MIQDKLTTLEDEKYLSAQKTWNDIFNNEALIYNDFHKYYTDKHLAVEPTNPMTHETFLIGFDESGDAIFFKSYDYTRQKDEAQADVTWVQNNCDHWEFGAASEFKLIHENRIHNIIIPHP